jgi:integrase
MPRKPSPWYRHQTGWWMSQIAGEQVKFVEGKNTDKDRRRARQKLDELLLLRAANPEPDSHRHTVASVIELYLRHHEKKLDARTFADRRRYLQLFAEEYGWRQVNDKDCLPYHLEEWLLNHPEWASDWTKNQVVKLVHAAFNWAARGRIIPGNPFRGFSHPAGEPRRPLTDKEFQALLRATSTWVKRARKKKVYPSDRKRRQRPSAGARFRQFLIYLRFTGCRPKEAYRLRWDDIDLENAVIVLRRHKTSKKTKKPRIIPLHPVVLKLLIQIRKRNEHPELVFLTHRRTPWNRSNLSLRVRRLRAIASVPDDAKLYGTRHAFGVRSVLNGVDLKTLAELMGHTSTRTTEHYLYLLSGHREHLADALRQANGRRPAS